jgi:hypothetical protein
MNTQIPYTDPLHSYTCYLLLSLQSNHNKNVFYNTKTFYCTWEKVVMCRALILCLDFLVDCERKFKMAVPRSTIKTIKLLMIGTILGFILTNVWIYLCTFFLNQNYGYLSSDGQVWGDDTQHNIKLWMRNKNVCDGQYFF